MEFWCISGSRQHSYTNLQGTAYNTYDLGAHFYGKLPMLCPVCLSEVNPGKSGLPEHSPFQDLDLQ